MKLVEWRGYKVKKTSIKVNKNRLRIIRVLVMAIILLCLQGSFLYANENLDNPDDEKTLIFIDGNRITNHGEKVFISEGMAMIPLRFISEELGADITWLKEGIIAIYKDDKMVYVPIHNNKYVDNTYDVDMGAEVRIIDSKTYVPVDFIADTFSIDVEFLEYNQEYDMLFLFSKHQSDEEMVALKEKAIREYEFSKKTLEIQDIDAINILNSIRASNHDVSKIYTIREKGYGVKYDVEDLVDNSVNFLYACNGKNSEDLETFIKENTDSLSKEALFDKYSLTIDEFLKHKKLVFKDYEKILDANDYFKVYLSALDLENKKAYLICFNYGQSKIEDNKIKIQKIEIVPKEMKDNYIEYSINSDIKKSESNEKSRSPHYELIKEGASRLWSVDSSDELTRTSFYVQKFNNGKYEDEVVSLYIENDNWLDAETKKDYTKMSNGFANKILNETSLSEVEIDDYINSGYRINVYAEIKAVDPSDNKSKWYRLMKNGKDYTPYQKIFKNKEQSSFVNLTENVIKNFPSSSLGACKNFVFKGNNYQKKMITVHFIDADTEEKIKSDKKIIEYSSDKEYIYNPPKTINNIYYLYDENEIKVSFDKNQKIEEKDIYVYYKAEQVSSEDADIVLDEWRLSKKVNSLVKDNEYEDAKLNFIIPKNEDDRTLQFSGIISPMKQVKFYVSANEENSFMKVKHNEEFDLQATLGYNAIYARCDAPILAKRPNINSGQVPGYFEAIGNVDFTLNTDEKHYYRPVKKELKHSFSDKSKSYNVIIGEKVPIELEHEDAVYNLAFKYLSHKTMPRIAPIFNSFEFYDPNTNEFGMSMSSEQVISVLPKVMMLYDTDDGKTSVRFVSGSQLRTIHPLSNHRSSFNMSNDIRIKSNVSNPKKAYTLARAMGNSTTPVVDKGAILNLNYSAKNILTVSSFNLALSTDSYNTFNRTLYNPDINHELYIKKLGIDDNVLSAKLGVYFDNINEAKHIPISLVKNDDEKIIKHSLEIRSGRVVAVDGLPYSTLSLRMRNVIDNMKLSSPVPSDNVLGAFAQNEGEAVTEQVFCDLSSVYRHYPHQLGSGWYNEDSTDLVLIEKQNNFDLQNSEVNIKAPLNVKGLETPINDRMKYSRGKKMDINMVISLDNSAYPVYKTIQSAFIIPNSER